MLRYVPLIVAKQAPLVCLTLFALLPWTLHSQGVHVVDTRDGSQRPGNCFVGTSSPWGLTNAAVFNVPVYTGPLLGVSLLNIQGTGCDEGALGHCIVRGSRNLSNGNADIDAKAYTVRASKANILELEYDSLLHQATTTQRTVVHRIIRQPNSQGFIAVDLGTGYVNARAVTLHTASDSSFSGTLEVGGFCTHQVYKPIHVYVLVQGASLHRMLADGRAQDVGVSTGKHFIVEGEMTEDTVLVGIGLSLVSAENARLNLEVEQGSAPFDVISAKNLDAWSKELGRFSVFGGSTADQRRFYSFLYRTMQHPNVGTDVNGDYVPYGSDSFANGLNYERTVTHDIWGHYQTNLGFYGLFLQDKAVNVMRTLVDMTKEAGITPQWDFLSRPMYIMYGDPFPLIVLDAVRNGTMSLASAGELFSTMLRSASEVTPVRRDVYHIAARGYIPGIRSDGNMVVNNVANHMEYSMADKAIAIIGEILGAQDASADMHKRSETLWNTFDSSSGWFRPRYYDGSWISGFDPDHQNAHSSDPDSVHPFKEGSGREFLFFPQHVRRQIANRIGGMDSLARKLDPLFSIPNKPYSPHNQMQMHLPWQYVYIPDSAHRTQHEVRVALLREFPMVGSSYRLPGNDDLGSTSAWYVMASMGLYPTLGFEGTWLVTAPLFDSVHVVMQSADNEPYVLRIIARGSANAEYVKSVTVDGIPGYTTHIEDKVIRKAREIVIERSEHPVAQPRWWNRAVPGLVMFDDSTRVEARDDLRQTILELEYREPGTLQVRRLNLLPGTHFVTIPMDSALLHTVRVRDLADPSGENAWIQSESRPLNVSDGHPVSMIRISPMPAADRVRVQGKFNSVPLAIDVYSVNGERMFSVDPLLLEFDVQRLPIGLYILRFVLLDHTISMPLLIQR